MPDDQVTIDPAFRPSPPRTGWSGWIRFGVLAAAAFLMGWLLRSPTSDESAATETTRPTVASTPDATATTRPAATNDTTMLDSGGGLEAPLGETVPGFADAITMALSGGIWGEEIEVVRWQSSQPAPETIVSFRENSPDDWGWFVGLDATGTWYAVDNANDVLSVRPVTAIGDDWWAPTRETVGLRVVSAAWHDTAPGRLAWLSCSRAPSGPTTLHVLDVADRSAEPLAVIRLPNACGESPMWISGWGDWGFALELIEDPAGAGWDEPDTWTVLLDPGGTELVRFEHGPGGADLVGAGPTGTVWNEEPIEGPPGSFLLSLDGRQRTPAPGVAAGEWVEQARWSPDGSRIALVTVSGYQFIHVVDTATGDTVAEMAANRSLRVVDAATGETAVEIDELAPVVFQTCWSSDGRYLLVGHDRDDGGAAGAALVVYDIESAAIVVEEHFREAHYFTEIRTFELSAVDVQFTPVEWGIGPEEEWGPGVYTIGLIADVSPLLPDQIEGLGGKLIWDETVVELCSIGIDEVGGGFIQIGDVFQTVEGCGANPNAMQEAFDEFGLPETACLVVMSGGVDHEYCAPLGNVVGR